MDVGFREKKRIERHIYSVQGFIKRVILTLTALVAVSSVVLFLLLYLPLKTELEKSLMDNFEQVSFIRYASLQNHMDRDLEGARSLSSRTVIQNAILEYRNGDMDMDELMAATQLRYEDGAKALEYLIRAERFVDGTIIASYISEEYKEHSCTTDDRLVKNNEISTALCLVEDHSYFVVLSPLLSEGQVLGYDKLIFDLSGQIHTLHTDTIKTELVAQDEFASLISGATLVRRSDTSSFFHKEGSYYQAFHMQDNTHFVSKQSEASLLDPVRRLSWQTLLVGIGILLSFTAAVYFLVIQYAKDELKDSHCTAMDAMSEANTDPLTKAGSRRFGEEFLSTAFEVFQKGETSPAVLLFDIDSFKQVNDTYGHSVGDLIIRSVAEAVQMSVRSGDVLLRWGGDEFIGIFAGLSKENAMPFAQKLLNAVSGLRIEVGSDAIKPTISIGISFFHEEDRSFIDAINRADRALHQSKTEGRNRAQADWPYEQEDSE